MPFLDYLHRIAAHHDLSALDAEHAMASILDGAATTPQIAAFLVALRMKGESGDEILGLARAMRARSTRIESGLPADSILDTCGTGGDGLSTFNVSTVTALVVAACGVPVAKHGNRSFSSHCGSADILEALGVRITLTPAQMGDCLRETGFAFLFAPALHPAMKHAQPARAEIKMRTAMNLLGPLTNPAGAGAQLVGAPNERYASLMAHALSHLGVRRAFVVTGSDGLDEITTTASTVLFDVHQGSVERRLLTPEDFGLSRAHLRDIEAPTKDDNLQVARAVLSGQPGPPRDIVLANASAALVASARAASWQDGVTQAAAALDHGRAQQLLERVIDYSNSLG